MDLLDKFLETKNFETPEAAKNYALIISRFLEYFKGDLTHLTYESLSEYLDTEFLYSFISKDGQSLKRRYAKTTLEKNINILRSFLNFLFQNAYIKTNFAASISAVEQSRDILNDDLPSLEELENVIVSAEGMFSKNKEYFSLRDLLIFNLIFHSGFSTSELATLKAHEPTLFGDSYQVVVSKPSIRRVFINKSDASLISRLITLRSKVDAKDDGLFISQKNRKSLAPRSLRYVISKLCSDAGVKEYSPENFKKAGMLAALSIGYDEEDLAKDLNVDVDYLKRRVRYSLNGDKVRSYSDLFERK